RRRLPRQLRDLCAARSRHRLTISATLTPFNASGAKMQGDKGGIGQLNAQPKTELTAITQYFLHARMLRHWGLGRLGKHEYDESIEEMRHADRLSARHLLSEGRPNQR